MHGKLALAVIEVHSLAVQRHADDAEPMVTEDRERIGVGRFLDEHRVPGPSEAAAGEVERLRNPAGQHQ